MERPCLDEQHGGRRERPGGEPQQRSHAQRPVEQDHSHEQRALRVEAAARPPQREHQQRGGERAEDCRKLRREHSQKTRDRQARCAQRGAGRSGGEGSADGGTAGKPEHEWVRERVAQEGLQRDSRDREARAHHAGEDHARDAQAEQHRRVGFDSVDSVAQRKLARAERQAHGHRDGDDRDQREERESRPERRGALH